MDNEKKHSYFNTQIIKWIISIIVFLSPLFLSISIEIKLYMMITLWAIMMWMFELIPEAIVGILVPVLYVLLNVTTPLVAFRGWSTSVPWITIGGLMISAVFVSSGLVKRIAYKALLLSGGKFNGIVMGLTLSCILITPIIPSVMAKVALMTPLVIGLCEVLGIEKKSQTASALMLVIFLALWSPKMAFLTASEDSIMTASILSEHYKYSLTWFGWLKDMFIPAILWTVLSVSLIYILRPQKIHLEKSYLQKQYNNLGKITSREKKAIAMSVLLLLLLVTDSLHHIDVTWIMVLIGALCFFPGIRLLEMKDFHQLKFSIVFFLVGAVSIGNVSITLGIDKWMINFITPYFENQTSFFLVLSIYIFSFFAIFLLNPLALVPTIMGSIADICGAMGYPSILGGYSMIMGFNQALLPYEVAPFMLIYGFGYLKMGHLVKVMLVRLLVGLIFMAVFTYPYWKFTGLIN